jgi:20S proteasome alpha/beta subunit
MTILIGLRCSDGVLIASDTQSEFGRGAPVKRLNASKIYPIGEHCAIAGAGTVAHIQKSIDLIRYGLQEAESGKHSSLSDDEFTDTIEKVTTASHKRYNIERAKYLGDPREREWFTPMLICAAKCGSDKFHLSLIHYEGLVEPIEDYGTAGSGAAYAEFLLKSLYTEGIKVAKAIPIAIYTIGEVKQIDPNCGGQTRVAIVKEKYEELAPEHIQEQESKDVATIDLISKRLLQKVLSGELNESKIGKLIGKA